MGADMEQRYVEMLAALLRSGPRDMADLLRGLAQWMNDRGYDGVDRMRGATSRRHGAEPAAFQRANSIKILQGS